MAHFESWDRATLNQFAYEATRKLLENDREIERLKAALAQERERFLEELMRLCAVKGQNASLEGRGTVKPEQSAERSPRPSRSDC